MKKITFFMLALLGGISVLATSCDKEDDWPDIKCSQSEFVIGSEGGTIDIVFVFYDLIWLCEFHCLYSDNPSRTDLYKSENLLPFEETLGSINYFQNDMFTMTITKKHIKLIINPNTEPTKRNMAFTMECMDAFNSFLVIQDAGL